MTSVDGLGFLAAGLVLATFCMKRLVPLRALAITSNVTFIFYGYCAGDRASTGSSPCSAPGEFVPNPAGASGACAGCGSFSPTLEQ